MPRLEGQPTLVEVAGWILDDKAPGAHRIHRLARTAASKEVHAGQVELWPKVGDVLIRRL